jgi:hypothetical protein
VRGCPIQPTILNTNSTCAAPSYLEVENKYTTPDAPKIELKQLKMGFMLPNKKNEKIRNKVKKKTLL